MSESKRIRALDSIRGLLLFQMILDHFSGPISKILYQCFGFFSAAEGFFFLSGFVGMLAFIGKRKRGENADWMRLRAFRIWKFHIGTVAFLVLLAFFCLPSIQHFFTGFYRHPGSGILFAGILAYTPEWLDVLPLYVFLLLFGSVFFYPMTNGRLKWVLLLSFALWGFGQVPFRPFVLRIFPDWVYPGFFDLISWQFLYFIGAACGVVWKKGTLFSSPSQFLDRIFPIALIVCIACFGWKHALLGISAPPEFWISKEHVGLLRLANFLAFVGVISYVVRHRSSWLDFSFCEVVGRHSLEAYSFHVILVYLWMATPGFIQYRLPWTVLAPILCVVLVWALSKMLDGRKIKKPKRIP